MDEDKGKKNERDLRPMVNPRVIQAFVTGLVIGNLNKAMLLGFTIGALGGAFVQQNYPGVPDVVNTWKDVMRRWNKSSGRGPPNS